MTAHVAIEVRDPSQVGSARRTAGELSRTASLSDTDAGRVALIVTELASNLVKHAGEGHLLLRTLPGTERTAGVELIALDRGRGMASIGNALRDGYSTAGTNGTGLGAVARSADLFDAYSRPDAGTAVVARVLARDAERPPDDLGAICVPYPGEDVSGDGWCMVHERGRDALLVIDGLGHGGAAADAARTGIRLFREQPFAGPVETVQRLHAGLRATRGAALAVADVDRARELVRYAGIGNIASTIIADGATRSLVSHHGTAGHDARRIQEFSYPFPRGAILVMHSDGLTARWSVERYPGLLERHPATIAAVLYRDFSRGRDDTTVIVLKGTT